MSYDFPAHESTRKRRRWGCTCGCVMILIIATIVGIAFFYFGLKPNEEFKRYAMLDNQTDGFGVLRVNPEDEGMQQFMEFLMRRLEKSEAVQEAGQAPIIATMRRLSKNALAQIFQPETMIYTSYNPATADENILISAPLKNRITWASIRQFIRDNIVNKPVSRDGTSELYVLSKSDTGTSTLLALSPKQLVVSDSQNLMIAALNYAHDSSRIVIPSEKLQYFIDELSLDQPPDGEDLAVAIVNEESRITNMIFVFQKFVGISGISERLAAALASEKLTFADISGMKLTADLASADLLKGELTLYCPNANTATRLASVFKKALPKVTGDQADGIFKLQGNATARGKTVAVTLQLSGIKAWIEKMIPVAKADNSGAASKTPATAQ